VWHGFGLPAGQGVTREMNENMPERRVAIPIAPDPIENSASTGSSIGDFIAQHSGMFRTRFQKLKSIIPIVLLLLLMDVFALLWVGSWLDKHNEDGCLRGILPGWKSTVSSFQACVIGDEVTDNAWGGAILARMAHESDYRAMVSEVCYPKYQTEIPELSEKSLIYHSNGPLKGKKVAIISKNCKFNICKKSFEIPSKD